MEALAIGLVGIALLYITGLLGTIRKSLMVVDQSLDTFNEVSSDKLKAMEAESKTSTAKRMGKLKGKLESDADKFSTPDEVLALLAGKKQEA